MPQKIPPSPDKSQGTCQLFWCRLFYVKVIWEFLTTLSVEEANWSRKPQNFEADHQEVLSDRCRQGRRLRFWSSSLRKVMKFKETYQLLSFGFITISKENPVAWTSDDVWKDWTFVFTAGWWSSCRMKLSPWWCLIIHSPDRQPVVVSNDLKATWKPSDTPRSNTHTRHRYTVAGVHFA